MNNSVLTSLFRQVNNLSNFSKYTVQRGETYSVLCQTSKMERFAKTVNDSHPLTFFRKTLYLRRLTEYWISLCSLNSILWKIWESIELTKKWCQYWVIYSKPFCKIFNVIRKTHKRMWTSQFSNHIKTSQLILVNDFYMLVK